VLRTAVDWVVALYFIVPLLIAVGVIYTSWWQEPPLWFDRVPVPLLAIALFLWSLTFRLRTFLEPADQVFLLQHRSLTRAIRRGGFAYSCSLAFLATALLFIVLCPLLVIGQGWQWPWIPVLALFTLASRLSVPVILELLGQRLAGIRRLAARSGVVIACGFLFVSLWDLLWRLQTFPHGLVHGSLIVVFALLAAWLTLRHRLHARGLFLHEISQERHVRLRLTALLLSQAGVRMSKSELEERRPPIWRRSQAITKKRDKVSLLMAAIVKSFFRSSDQWFFLVRYLSVSAYALIQTSGWVTLIVYPGLLYLLYKGVHSYCVMALKSPYLQLFQWTDEERREAMEQAIFRILLPIALLLLLVAILV